VIRRLRPRTQPKRLKDLTEDERQAFFADMRARTAALLAERTVPKAAEPDPSGAPASGDTAYLG
jgi:hypothetical protein